MEKDNDKRQEAEESLWKGSESNPENRPTKPKEVKCLRCKDDVAELKAFVLEENKYTVELIKNLLQWSVSEVVETSAVRTIFNCPSCEGTIFTVRGGGSTPQVVVDFLKGVRMTWVRDASVRAMMVEILNKRLAVAHRQDGCYYAEGFPQAGGEVGIYFVDPSSKKGMTPVEA